MNKRIKQSLSSVSFEGAALVTLSVVFVCVLGGAWEYAMKLRQTVAANAAGMNVDPAPMIEVEHLRSIAEAQISDARSYFLLGSKTLFDKQGKEKETFTTELAGFEKQYGLPEVPPIVKKLETLIQQQQEIFDQATDFRDKQTESKIVGQFYQSKTVPIRAAMNENLDEIVKILNADLERTKAKAKQAGLDAEAQIPKGMTKFIETVAALFLAMALIIARMLRKRLSQLAERGRLVNEAKKAILSRDEVISAITRDLKEPLNTIKETAEGLITSPAAGGDVTDRAELIKSSVTDLETSIKDICDQKKSDLGGVSIRVEQLAIDEILEEARLTLAPGAKQRDVRLQFEAVNPPVSAFADRERTLRILSNLIGNAVKFSAKHSRVVIKVRSDQQFVNISVTDNGPGIPEKHLGEIFENFWQASKTATQGAGIGLAVVKTLVEAQGGTVRVDSLVGHGTTFTFSLPRRRPVGLQVKNTATAVRLTPRPAAPTQSETPEGPTV